MSATGSPIRPPSRRTLNVASTRMFPSVVLSSPEKKNQMPESGRLKVGVPLQERLRSDAVSGLHAIDGIAENDAQVLARAALLLRLVDARRGRGCRCLGYVLRDRFRRIDHRGRRRWWRRTGPEDK